jgi:non-specific serine/threonine protein kinase
MNSPFFFSSITFTDEQIRNHALPSVIEEGKKLFTAGSVHDIRMVDANIIANIKGVEDNKVILNCKDNKNIGCDCTCGFSYGGVCEHAVAVMHAVSRQELLQAGLTKEKGLHFKSIDKPDIEQELFSVRPKPTARLYLSEYNDLLTVEVRFAYYPGKPYNRFIEFRRSDSDNYRLIPVIDSSVCKVIRSKARENEIINDLTQYGLRSYQLGYYTPVEDPRTWISEMLPILAEKGYELFGHKSLVKSRVHENRPELRVTIRSKGDSFICSMTVDFDGIPASLVSIIRALHSADNFVQLSDGSSGRLPQPVIDLLMRLFAVIEPGINNECFTVKQHHLPLLDMLHDIADTCDEDDTFKEKRDALQNFKGIEKKTQPEGFNGVMRPYQIAGYEWMYFLQAYNFGGCLADDMGLGKTIQTLALFINENSHKENKKLPNIVVAPTSVLFNWEREAKRFAPKLLTALYYGSDRKRKAGSLIYADIVLTTYGTLLRDCDILNKIDFNYAVLDEAQLVKNPYSKIRKAVCQLTSKHRLVLTGTPVENNLSELWSIFSFINTDIFGTLSSYKKNIISKIQHGDESSGLKILRKMVFPFILRRLKKQVAKELPPKTESVIYTEMLPRQKQIYTITKEAYLGKILDLIERNGIEGTGTQIFEGMLRLRQICCHPTLVDSNYSGDSGKFQVCDTYIDEILSGGHRILIFSQFETVLKLVRERLKKRHISSELLTGKTKNRSATVDRFQTDSSIPVFLITLKAGGVGLNLTEADYVLHLDPWWNPAAEDQASDRAHRIGQKRHVFIYKFITKDSIEERVLDLQKRKKELVERVIHPETSFFKKLGRDDIISLFS